MDNERKSAEWTKTPQAALAYYMSLTFEEQTALAYVAQWHRVAAQERAAELYEQLKTQYEKAGEK